MGCRSKKNPSEMIRICTLKSGEIKVNVNEGRGAYICKDRKCLDTAIKKSGISRALKCQINTKVYDELLGLIEE